MKKIFFILFLSPLLFLNVHVIAQNWINGGNNLNAIGRLGTTSSQSLAFITSNTERARITNGGNFGIGTGSPITKLHVNGFGSFGNRVTSSNAIRALNLVDVNAVMRVLRVDPSYAPSVELISRTSADGADVAYWDFYAQPSDASFRIRDRKSGGAGLDRVTISGSGNVGIGTTSPSYKLHVENTGTAVYANSTSGGFGVYGKSTYLGVYGVGASYGVYGYTGSSSSGTGVFGYGYYGVYGSGGTYGVYGTGGSYGLYGNSSSGYGVFGSSNSLGVYGTGGSSGSYGTYGYSGNIGAYGYGSKYGTYGSSAGTGAYGFGTSYGVFGTTSAGTGVYGSSTNGLGGSFYSTNYYGIRAGTGNSAGNWAGVFDGNVYSFGAFQTSDKNLKKNITDVGDAMSIINKLKPKNYEFRNDEKFALLHLPKGSHYGLIAQDLQEVLPNLVAEVSQELKSPAKQAAVINPKADGTPEPLAAETKETKETTETIQIKTVNYIELIPIMVKAMQEQQATIDKQNDKIEALTQLVNQLSQNSHSQADVKLSGASLGQSAPNPNSTNARISYRIPNNSSSAVLVINNDAGQKVKQMQLDKSGLVNIDTSSLGNGTYFYTLLVNGTPVDTKKMVVNR